jgi:dihydroneopterin aldolase
LEEEGRIGSKYRVDVIAEADFSNSANNDDLTQTVDYVVVYDVVLHEMGIRSKLIETVAKRISDRLEAEYPWVVKWQVAVTKYAPPVGGMLGQTTIVWKSGIKQQ